MLYGEDEVVPTSAGPSASAPSDAGARDVSELVVLCARSGFMHVVKVRWSSAPISSPVQSSRPLPSLCSSIA